jgi:hypothetical protein
LSGRGYLLLRRCGTLWGVANAAVEGRERGRDGLYRISTPEGGPGHLVADEVLGVVPDLRVWPAAVIRRFWPEPCRGLAVHGELPVVVVDASRPSRLLRPEGKDDDAPGRP